MDNVTSKRKVFSGLIWKSGERIFAQVVSFVVSIILARMLMPEQYAIISMMIVFINIADVFVTSGFSKALIQKKDADETDFSSIFYCSAVFSVVIYMICYFSAPYISMYYKTPELTLYFRVFSLRILIGAYNSIQSAYISKKMMFKKFFFATSIGTVLSAVVGIYMAYKGYGVWALIAQYMCNTLVDTIVLAVTVKWHPRLIFSWKASKQLLNFGWKVLVADLIGVIFENVRSLLIGHYYDKDSLAFFNKGKQFPTIIGSTISTSVQSVLFPAMSNQGGDVKKVREMTRESIKVSSYVMFPVMAGLAAVAEPLVTVLLTEKWIMIVPYLRLFCISNALSIVSSANLQAINALGRSDITLKLEFVKKPFLFLLLVITIPLNVKAVAYTVPLYSFIACIINMIPNRKVLKYTIVEQMVDYLPSVLMSAVMYLSVFFFSRLLQVSPWIELIMEVIVGSVVYIGLSVLSKNSSLKVLLSVLKKGKK